MKNLLKIIFSFSFQKAGIYLLIIALFLIIDVSFAGVVYSGPVDWKEVTPSTSGRQWVDLGSIKNKGSNEATILTKYLAYSGKSQNDEVTIFVMQINCKSKLYKDNYINGIPQFKPKWKSAEDDFLINNVIEQVCPKLTT